MIHVHWGNHVGGARNYRAGEYDTCEYFLLIIGIPIYVSFQGCFHVINRPALRPERLREFAQTFLGLPDLPKRTVLPLRPMRILKWMWFYANILGLLGALNIPGVAVLIVYLIPKPFPNGNPIVLYVCGAIGVVFLVALFPYLFLRRPSRRQARIRRVVASRLGPFSDPADWAEQLVAHVTPAFSINVPSAEALLRKAEELVKEGHYEDALVVARMTLALLASPFDGPLAERAEDITEECLRAAVQEDE